METLCWNCRIPGTGGCSWDKNLEPVEGWTAQKTQLRITTGNTATSYCVQDCPLYQPVDRKGRDKGKSGMVSALSEGALDLFLAAGLNDQEIADRVGLAEITVRRRRRKLLNTRRQA